MESIQTTTRTQLLNMAKNPVSFTRIISGISDFDKETVQTDGVAFLRRIDYRNNPRRWTLLPKTSKESGNTVVDLPLWGDQVSGTSANGTYIYGNAGNIYLRSSAASYSLLRTVASSSGNGLSYFGEDNFLYYTTDKTIGRYGQLNSSTPAFSDDFLGAQGGIPTNTASLDLESGSSQYATAADSASLSITGDLTLEGYFKPESLPTVGNSMSLITKWNENSDERSYRFDIYAVSGYFGDGSDSSLTISSNTTEAPIDSSAAGTSGAYSLTATNASFAAGQIVLIHQTRGTGAGTWQRNTIASYTAGTITLVNTLNFSYNSTSSNKAQVRVLKQHTSVTINSGITYTAKAWDGTVGGILAFISNGTTDINGTITATGKGFLGGSAVLGAVGTVGQAGKQGEGTSGARDTQSSAANGNGGGGGQRGGDAGAGGGGGGHSATASNGENGQASTGGTGGTQYGTTDLTTMVFGGGGGSGGGESNDNSGPHLSGAGGNGGGIIFITAATIDVDNSTGAVVSSGNNGGVSGVSDDGGGGGGGGGGGAILLKAQTATLNTTRVTAAAGSGAAEITPQAGAGGTGSTGRIHLDYLTSYTGTTTPTLNATQDNTLVTTTTYQLRLSISSTGVNEEILTKNTAVLTTASWIHLAVSWDASASTAEFYENGGSLGQTFGALTAIYDSTAVAAIGAEFDSAGTAISFFDGKVDDIRIWSALRTTSQIFNNKDFELDGSEVGLAAYWEVDSSTSDSTANTNTLTLVAAPSYDTADVPFPSPTTRLDIDQSDTSTGSTYAVGTTIDEGATGRQTFVPAKDPQKSISINIDTIGTTADWTLTVHDSLNRVVASKTVANASLNTGVFEFVFSEVWRPIIGASYHFHLTVTNTTGTPDVIAGSLNNLETGQFKSYYQFLVEDDYHPIERMLNFIAIGNERYVAKYDAVTYEPHKIKLPAEYKVHCFAKWREYLAIGCIRGTNIYDYDQGIIFFWDGISDTYNFYVSVPEGAINAMYGSTGTLYIIAGYQGDLLEYVGGDKATKVKRVPKITKDKYIEVFPSSLNMWQTLLRIGYSFGGDSTEVERGVYSYGKLNELYPDSLSYDYIISTGTSQSTSLKTGMVLPVGRKLLIGWQDNVSYGVDVVDPAGDPAPSGSIEFMVRDEGGVWKEKLLQLVRADFEPLESGQTIELLYKLNRNDSWTSITSTSTADDVKLRGQVKNARHNEYQIRLNLSTTDTTPAILGVTAEEDVLEGEGLL